MEENGIKLEPGLYSDLLDWMRFLAFTEVSCSQAIVVVPVIMMSGSTELLMLFVVWHLRPDLPAQPALGYIFNSKAHTPLPYL